MVLASIFPGTVGWKDGRILADRLRLVNEHELLASSARSTARLDAAIDDHALSVGRFLDGNQPEALCEPDGRTGLSPADVGALGDACITDDGCTAIASAFKRSVARAGRPSRPFFP